jgi:hypothetical protein
MRDAFVFSNDRQRARCDRAIGAERLGEAA